MQKQILEETQQLPPVEADACTFDFYGASRFETPTIGMVFRRNGGCFRVKAVVGSSRNFLAEFDKVWTFVTECERVN